MNEVARLPMRPLQGAVDSSEREPVTLPQVPHAAVEEAPKSMNVKIEIIPHDQQRYPTVGDWLFKPFCQDCNATWQTPFRVCPACKRPTTELLVIRVSQLSDWRREMLIAVHELVEVLLCKHDGVTQKRVDKFDMAYEKKREPGDDSEPGDDPKAPYVKQHCVATGVERILAAELGVSWKQYGDELCALP